MVTRMALSALRSTREYDPPDAAIVLSLSSVVMMRQAMPRGWQSGPYGQYVGTIPTRNCTGGLAAAGVVELVAVGDQQFTTSISGAIHLYVFARCRNAVLK
jgi:hypothetical protein